MKWTAPNMWQGGECFIVGGGYSWLEQLGVPEELRKDVIGGKYQPSVYASYFESIKNKHLIAINNAYLIGDFMDVLFFGDCSWYLVHRRGIVKFNGLSVTCCPRFAQKNKKQQEGIKYLAKDKEKRKGISTNRTTVAWNGNSGGASISLAAHFGVKRIVLLGFDMSGYKEGKTMHYHFHSPHTKNNQKKMLKSPPFARHMKGFPHIACDAKEMGIEILNASPNSAIDSFKKVKLEQVLK